MAYIDLGNVKGEKGDRGLQGKGATFYGTCDTASNVHNKVVTIDDIIEPHDGLVVFVTFTYENTYSGDELTIAVNDSAPAQVVTKGDNSVAWDAGDSVMFAYNGNKWHYLDNTGSPYVQDSKVASTKVLSVGEQSKFHESVSADKPEYGLEGTIKANRIILSSKTGEKRTTTPNSNAVNIDNRLDEFGGLETDGWVNAPYIVTNNATIKNRAVLKDLKATTSSAGSLTADSLSVSGASTLTGKLTAGELSATNATATNISSSSIKKDSTEVLVPTVLFRGQGGRSVSVSPAIENFKYIDVTICDPYRDAVYSSDVTYGLNTIRIDTQYAGITHGATIIKTVTNTVQIYALQIKAIGNVVTHSYMVTNQNEYIGCAVLECDRVSTNYVTATMGGETCIHILKVVGWK